MLYARVFLLAPLSGHRDPVPWAVRPERLTDFSIRVKDFA
jgi:hypothetical protein